MTPEQLKKLHAEVRAMFGNALRQVTGSSPAMAELVLNTASTFLHYLREDLAESGRCKACGHEHRPPPQGPAF